MSRRRAIRSRVGDWLFCLIGRLVVWFAKQIARFVAWLVVLLITHPRTSATATGAVAGVVYVDWRWLPVISGAVFVALSTWKVAHPGSFNATVGTWLRTWWRRWWTYRRQWSNVLTRCELVVHDGVDWQIPKLKKVRTTAHWDRLTVRMQAGQELSQWVERIERLRGAFGGLRATIRELSPLMLRVDLMRSDPLLATVPATPIPASTTDINWSAIPVGLDEYEDPFTVSIVGGHTACAGSTGSGKAGLQWNILRGLGPAIADGTVRPVGIDPKGKELRRGRSLFAEYAVTPEDTLALLEKLVGEMNMANEADGAAGERDFAPGRGRPLTLIDIDELAPLLKYWPRRIRDKIEDALGLLLTQGRAVGFIVLGGIQEPTKDVFQIRDLFTRRIALRLPTESHTDAALIEHAIEYGALCHQVSEHTPGVLFSLQDGARSTLRARLGYVQDHHIDELVDYVEQARKVVSLDEWRAEESGPAAAAA